jgi:SAM-dependent methyltransferase
MEPMNPNHSALLKAVERYYTGKVLQHGPTPQGVDWNSAESQQIRFEQLLKLCGSREPSALNDFGCGYGALAAFLRERGAAVRYTGYDISTAMIEHAQRIHSDLADVDFCSDLAALGEADYTVASGIFNVRFDVSDDAWGVYVLDTIATMAGHSRHGFAFNMLTDYADPERMRRDLYYADALYYFDYCRRTYSRWVALLHDYQLYEFTLCVRLD